MITLKAYAKINISLDITGKREDGYHLLKTVMQTVSLCDIISAQKTDSGIELTCNRRYIPTDERNIVCRVAAAFFGYTGIRGGVKLDLKKYVPCGAGLGGGSSDGAAALRALCLLYGVRMPRREMVELTQSIGADIPFFVYGSTALCEGIGEIVTPVTPMPDCRLVIVKPKLSLSTAAVFSSPLTVEKFGNNSTDGVLRALNGGSVEQLFSHAENALEPASIEMCPEIETVKRLLYGNGAVFAMMSGSGSAVYGVFHNNRDAGNAYERLRGVYRDVYIARPCRKAFEIITPDE